MGVKESLKGRVQYRNLSLINLEETTCSDAERETLFHRGLSLLEKLNLASVTVNIIIIIIIFSHSYVSKTNA